MKGVISQLKGLALSKAVQSDAIKFLRKGIRQQQDYMQQVGDVALIPSKITSDKVIVSLGEEHFAELSAEEVMMRLTAQVEELERQQTELKQFYFPIGLVDDDTLKDIDSEVRTFVAQNKERVNITVQNSAVNVRLSGGDSRVAPAHARVSKFGLLNKKLTQ